MRPKPGESRCSRGKQKSTDVPDESGPPHGLDLEFMELTPPDGVCVALDLQVQQGCEGGHCRGGRAAALATVEWESQERADQYRS